MKIRWVHVLLWGLVVLYFTCGKTSYLVHFSGFQFDAHPDFRQVLRLDLDFSNPIYTLSKVSHCIGFLILDVLLSIRLRNHGLALIITILFGAFTEFAQLFFFRDGRIYDVFIDSIGAFVSFYGVKWIKLRRLND